MNRHLVALNMTFEEDLEKMLLELSKDYNKASEFKVIATEAILETFKEHMPKPKVSSRMDSNGLAIVDVQIPSFLVIDRKIEDE